MKTKLDCHQVLAGRVDRHGFIHALNITEAKQNSLRRARDLIRQRLRSGLGNWQTVLSKSELFEAPQNLGSKAPTLRPRFRMQGSMVYRTANVPVHIPPQDIDLDDGMYMPISFLTVRGQLRPTLASKGFFLAVERILEPLCKAEGWTLDKSKPSCVRIVIADDAHIDLPLYAIPDDEFLTLVEATALMAADAIRKHEILEGTEMAEDSYRHLPTDRIMLAHRTEGWKQSDPRKIEDWFRNALDIHGEILRRLCRYLKGWRDFQWPAGALSSITLMACAVKALDDLRGTLPTGRDDFALLEVAKTLPGSFSRSIPCPIPGLPALDEDWSPADRREVVQFAENLHADIDAALNGTLHRGVALRRLINAFGDRIPSDESLVSVNDEETEVLSHEPVRMAAPMVTRTTSG